MHAHTNTLTISTKGKGTYEITSQVEAVARESGVTTGTATVFLQPGGYNSVNSDSDIRSHVYSCGALRERHVYGPESAGCASKRACGCDVVAFQHDYTGKNADGKPGTQRRLPVTYPLHSGTAPLNDIRGI